MNIPERAFNEYGGDQQLYADVHRYSSMFLSNDEIAQLTGVKLETVREYGNRLRKVLSTLPPDEMTQEALYGYVSMSDVMLQDMMRYYSIMNEDFEIDRNQIRRTDGKKTMRVQPKDMIALMQTLMKTQLERAAVLSKFAAVGATKPTPITNGLTRNALMSNSSQDIQVDVVDVEFTDAN